MTVLKILQWPDARLSRVCAPVADVSAVRALIGDMFDTMYDAPGRGLAAPQVGRLVRVFVMDVGWKSGVRTPMACINPEILAASDEVGPGEEGCLSIPGVSADIVRPLRVTLGYTDAHGACHSVDLDGFAARCAQHELDHLDGLVTFDRLEGDARADLVRAYRAIA